MSLPLYSGFWLQVSLFLGKIAIDTNVVWVTELTVEIR